MSDESPEQAIAAKLRALKELDNCPPFSRNFFRLIGRLVCRSREARLLANVLLSFLDLELWYYRSIADLDETEAPARDLADIEERREISLRDIAEQLRGLRSLAVAAEIPRHLLLAECLYHLGHTSGVIAELRRAIELGGDRPIVCFALGYNLYWRGMEEYTAYLSDLNSHVVTDQASFEAQCAEAINAFRRGLTSSTFDGYLHWWIATAQESMGRLEEAAASYRRAERSDPLNFREPVSRKLRGLAEARHHIVPLDQEAPEYSEHVQDPEELERFDALLRRAPGLTRMLNSDGWGELPGE